MTKLNTAIERIMTAKTNSLVKVLALWFLQEYVLTVQSQEYCAPLAKDPWSYQVYYDNGPYFWGHTYPMCDGHQQSPINIDTHDVKTDSSLKELNLNNYNIPVASANVLNDGHTVVITPEDGTTRTIVINSTVYSLRQLHFHWNKDGAGTEHALDDDQYDMEGHFVHSSDRNETAVVGVFYKASYYKKNDAFKVIVDTLQSVRFAENQTWLKSKLYLNDLLPSNPSPFYRYQGSLTTPPCTEGVTWSILKDFVYIGQKQLSAFYQIYAVPRQEATRSCRLTDNVRPLQKINNRVVTCSQD